MRRAASFREQPRSTKANARRRRSSNRSALPLGLGIGVQAEIQSTYSMGFFLDERYYILYTWLNNIAQMVNVLQAMIITDKERMVLTPTYYVFKMYVPFQDATFIPVTFDAGWYTHGTVALPHVDAIAAKDTNGKLWMEITNLDPNEPIEIEAALAGITAKSASGETLTAPKVDSVNTFDAANTVMPKPISAKVQGGKLTLKLEPKSITVVSVEQ